MMAYYVKIDEKYHDEVYDLLLVLEQDQIDKAVEKQRKKAQARLDELVKISQ